MAFPTTPILASGSSVAGFTVPAYGDGSLQSVGGSFTGLASSFGGGEFIGPAYTDVEVYATLFTIGGGGENVVIHAREDGTGSGWNGYGLSITPGTGWDMLQITGGGGGGSASLASGPDEFVNLDVVGYSVIGSVITVYRNGVVLSETAGANPATDATWASGFIGLEIYDVNWAVRNFGGGTPVTPVTALASDTPPIIGGRGAC